MDYLSTRGQHGPVGYEQALLTGLARDGGLFLPASWPRFDAADIKKLAGRPYHEIAGAIMAKFTEGELSQAELTSMAEQAYAGFDHPAIAPLTGMADNIHLLELFHGPTIAFKDYAMQFLSRAFDRALQRSGQRAVILGATSGDTGSAALEAFKGRAAVDIFILFPKGRVSPVQQKQMTSVLAEGAHAIALDGDFDDCQDLVKACFNDHEFRDQVGLSAINSINWARLMPQIVYYFTAALALGAADRPIAFSVPTGNFGNVFAGWAAKQMGLPIERLIIASNQNDILTRFFADGMMAREQVQPSLSPSMDIQVSSNFERLLFELLDRDGMQVAAMMAEFARSGRFAVPADVLARAKQDFAAYCLDDKATSAVMARVWQETGQLIDPHSAVGLGAAWQARADNLVDSDIPIVSLACAHPAKFPDAVAGATGQKADLPTHLADLMERDEASQNCPNDKAALMALIEQERRR